MKGCCGELDGEISVVVQLELKRKVRYRSKDVAVPLHCSEPFSVFQSFPNHRCYQNSFVRRSKHGKWKRTESLSLINSSAIHSNFLTVKNALPW